MIDLFLSLFLGFSAATIMWAFFLIEKRLSPNTLRRLERIKRKSNDLNGGFGELELSMEDLEYRVKAIGNILRKYKFTQEIKELIQLADVDWHIDTFIFFSFLCSAPFIFLLLTPYKLMSVLAVFSFFIPTIYLNYLSNKRFLDFSKQFPDALNLMASSLRAGHPLLAAISMVIEEMPKPICTVFEATKTDISLGLDTKDAFYSMIKTMPKSLDLKFFITAVLIQKEVGGNLAELLDSLSETIRERFKLMGQLRVQTAQTRLSGMIIGVVPVVVLLVVFFMSPEYIKPLFNTRDGQMAMCIAFFLIIAGFVSIKKISDIEI